MPPTLLRWAGSAPRPTKTLVSLRTRVHNGTFQLGDLRDPFVSGAFPVVRRSGNSVAPHHQHHPGFLHEHDGRPRGARHGVHGGGAVSARLQHRTADGTDRDGGVPTARPTGARCRSRRRSGRHATVRGCTGRGGRARPLRSGADGLRGHRREQPGGRTPPRRRGRRPQLRLRPQSGRRLPERRPGAGRGLPGLRAVPACCGREFYDHHRAHRDPFYGSRHPLAGRARLPRRQRPPAGPAIHRRLPHVRRAGRGVVLRTAPERAAELPGALAAAPSGCWNGGRPYGYRRLVLGAWAAGSSATTPPRSRARSGLLGPGGRFAAAFEQGGVRHPGPHAGRHGRKAFARAFPEGRGTPGAGNPSQLQP